MPVASSVWPARRATACGGCDTFDACSSARRSAPSNMRDRRQRCYRVGTPTTTAARRGRHIGDGEAQLVCTDDRFTSPSEDNENVTSVCALFAVVAVRVPGAAGLLRVWFGR